MTASTDAHILDLLRRPDSREEGFRLLLATYQERLYWHIRRMVGSHEDTDDILQDCLVKVHRNIQRFEGKSQLYTWMYRIATNEALTFLKKRSKRPTHSMDDETSNVAVQLKAEAHLDGQQVVRMLETALAGLPEKQKLVFRLRYYEEMSYKEMSVLLKTSQGALKASYHHAVKKLEAALKDKI